MTTHHDKLTRFPEGSVRELWTITLPLILAGLSGNLMIFLDRLILAHFSTDAMNAATTAGIVVALFQYGAVGISSIAEVFVGQYNGSKQKSKMGVPAWQMIWFSLMTYIVFLPLALWGGQYLLAESFMDLAMPYYQWLMFFGPSLAIFSALAAFFIGKGKTRLVFIVTIIGNITNLVLNIALVFGIKGWFQPMGIKGSAIATVISQVIMVLILFSVFLNSNNRKTYGTKKFAFNFDEFWKCLKIGTPNSVGCMIEITAWAIILNMIANLSNAHITVWTIANSVFVVFAFTSNGMSKAVITIAANLIGAKKKDLVRKMMFSAIKLTLIIAAIIAIPMIIVPDLFYVAFLPQGTASIDITSIEGYIRAGLIGMWLFFLFDSLTWIFAGVFTAAGDTKFTMIMNAVSAWLFAIVPVYFWVVKGEGSPSSTCFIVAGYAMLNCFAFFLRYRTHKWKSKHVISSAEEIVEA